MALQINGQFELPTGQVLNSVYARTNTMLALEGNVVDASPTYWYDEASYKAGKQNLVVFPPFNFSYAYDRSTDGVDLLSFANQKAAETFESAGFTVTITDL